MKYYLYLYIKIEAGLIEVRMEGKRDYVNFSSIVPYVFIWDVYTCFVDVYRQKEIDHPLSLENL